MKLLFHCCLALLLLCGLVLAGLVALGDFPDPLDASFALGRFLNARRLDPFSLAAPITAMALVLGIAARGIARLDAPLQSGLSFIHALEVFLQTLVLCLVALSPDIHLGLWVPGCYFALRLADSVCQMARASRLQGRKGFVSPPSLRAEGVFITAALLVPELFGSWTPTTAASPVFPISVAHGRLLAVLVVFLIAALALSLRLLRIVRADFEDSAFPGAKTAPTPDMPNDKKV